MDVGFVAALPAEGQCLASGRLRPQSCTRLAEGVNLQLSGMGAENATEAAEKLVAGGSQCLISWGMAAGLDPSLRPGQLCLPELVTTAKDETFETDTRWRENLRAVLKEIDTVSGTLFQSGEIVTTVAAKKQLHQKSNASALDMESGAVARVAHNHDLLFLAVRAIVDDASMTLPAAARQAMGTDGRLKIDVMLHETLRSPRDLGHLWDLAKGFKAAQKTLTRACRIAGPQMGAPTSKTVGRKP